ncbi:MAG TPA: beta-phosphoglucomutase family hydrolase [Intrasporangium sp.]|uniref:beta-phosphoglucomutase family hydrolase n=1 Tax=Intrasporangium sp. TaxID=1925024 RepID=UPI002D79B6D3|nr:beta-phosphoglucomutase family hydrolase [Intrasporangium sp.]HET7399400.1 beta-phosphoglucomutase family hydrolase [Intrasporangium sp.]
MNPSDGEREAPAPTGALPPQEAVIFDMDGVVTDTADVHAVAWKQLFDEVLGDPSLPSGPYAAFDPATDYLRHVDGRSREDGVVAFLESRGLELPVGTASDPPGRRSVHGLAARKQEIYGELIAERGVRVFPGTVGLLGRLRAGGVPVALVTASRNARQLLAQAGLADAFDVVVDGQVAAERALPGKPDPAVFRYAADRLGVDPARVAVVEDATAGVVAARRGGFGLVVGIDRAGHREELEAAGADVVVDDVAQLDLGALRADPWSLVYDGFDPAHEAHREALTTLGNGYVGTRGAAPERAADAVHYPGTYLAGVYNRLVSTVHGRQVEDEHLVNAPNWLVLDVRVDRGAWWSAGGLRITGERRVLDLRRGVLSRSAVLTDATGRRLRLSQHRLVSMARPHSAALQTTLVAQGWDGPVSVRSGVDGGIRNSNVADLRALANEHLRTVTAERAGDDVLLVETETIQSHVRIATAARTTVTGAAAVAAETVQAEGDRYALEVEVVLRDGEPVTIDKTVAIFTSRDRAISTPALAALGELDAAPGGFAGLLPAHERAWAPLWERYGLDLGAGVPARGLHGEGYGGHVFWDELFVLPVLTAHQPWVSRALLDYRFRRLGAARRAAAAEGRTGAMFPWQSGSDGREETPRILHNARSGRWLPDNSRRQRHVGLAVAHNAWQYYEATGDRAWLAHRGGDLIIEVARFFASLATHDPAADRFHLAGVMGPDEYHDGYPDAPGLGLRDNAYTNVLAAWVCARAVEVLAVTAGAHCDELRERLGVGADEPESWERLSRRLTVPFHDGVISQFAGYEALAELDWGRYRAAYGNIGRLDLILEAEGDSTNRYKLAKQADVLMLVYLLGPDGLRSMLDRLGYPVTLDALAATVAYYLERTAHGSTLSRVVHASVLARMDPARGWATFREALDADLDDTQGGTTGEGIHLGAMAGTIDLVARAFAGQRTSGDTVVFDPCLPEGLRRVGFAFSHRGQRLTVALDHDELRVSADACAANPHVRVRVGMRVETIPGGRSAVFPLTPGGAVPPHSPGAS